MIREQAGLAQTLTETANVLRGMGMQDITDERVALKNYVDVRDAYQRDITRIRNSQHPDVLAAFEANYTDNDQESPLGKTFKPVSFPQVTEFGANKETKMSELDKRLSKYR